MHGGTQGNFLANRRRRNWGGTLLAAGVISTSAQAVNISETLETPDSNVQDSTDTTADETGQLAPVTITGEKSKHFAPSTVETGPYTSLDVPATFKR